ncbi:MAG TPA: metallophosphoesterase [Acidobacteriaceae bacterium]
MTTAALAATGLAFYAGEISRHELEVVRFTVHLPNLPSAFHGMRIAQLSDVHYDNYTEPFFVRRAVRRINELAPDLVLLTGDFVSKGPQMYDLSQHHAQACAEVLSHINCPQRFAIMGNHDVAVGVDVVTNALVNHDIPVLSDTHVPLERGPDRLWLVGLKDISAAPLPDLKAAMPPPGRQPVLLMVHEPDYMDILMESPLGRRADLVFAGHTHGGQVCIPGVGPIFAPPLGKKYISGLFRFPHDEKMTQLYVNRGLGTVGLPLRLWCPPEITLITLSAEPV